MTKLAQVVNPYRKSAQILHEEAEQETFSRMRALVYGMLCAVVVLILGAVFFGMPLLHAFEAFGSRLEGLIGK